jgi:adenylate cyclase
MTDNDIRRIMPMTASYASLIVGAKRSLKMHSSTLSALSVEGMAAASAAEGGSTRQSFGQILEPELRNAIGVTRKVSILAGLLGHRQLRLLAASLRAFIHRAALAPRPRDYELLQRAADYIRECAESIEAPLEYGDLVLPDGNILRPALSKKVHILPFCKELCPSESPSLSPYDGRILEEDDLGRYHVLISSEAAARSRSRGTWLSLVYFDPGRIGLDECIGIIGTLIEEGVILNYGSLAMRSPSLEEKSAALPCYFIAETVQEPGEALPPRFPGIRLLRVISSPHKAFLPDIDAIGPQSDAFILGSTAAEAYIDADGIDGEEGTASSSSSIDGHSEGAKLDRKRVKADIPDEDSSSTGMDSPGYSSSAAEAAFSMELAPIDDFSIPDIAQAEDSGEIVPHEASQSPQYQATDDQAALRAASLAIDAGLPPGILLPHLEETEPAMGTPQEYGLPHASVHPRADRVEPQFPGEEPRQKVSPQAPEDQTGQARKDLPHGEQAGQQGQRGQTSRGTKPEITPRQEKIRLPIAVKLIGIISLVILSALTAVISLASTFFRSEIRNTIEDSNLQVADSTSQKFDSDFQSVADRARQVMQAYTLRSTEKSTPEELAGLASELFTSEEEILAISAFPEGGGAARYILNMPALGGLGVQGDTAEKAIAAGVERVRAAGLGGAVCLNVSPDFKEPTVLALFPYAIGEESGSLAAVFITRDRFQGVVARAKKTIRQIRLISSAGDLLAHPDSTRVTAGESLAGSPEFGPLSASKFALGNFSYADPAGARQLAYYSKLGTMGAWVLVTLDEAKAFEAVDRILLWNACITVMILAAAVLIVYFFSKTITRPIRALVEAAKRIEQGHFHLGLRARARDEIGLLTNAFVHMGDGLAERERLKDTFGRFVNKEIAERAAKGSLKLGGERKRVTVFFSDIRGFTGISERLEPEEVVDFLNKYMTRMVGCVNATGGNVDKFIGDAIMAVWGAPLSDYTEAEYAERAVNAALMMRSELAEFNKDRGGPRSPVINIGCGLNSGPVIVGQIGSTERLEYTVIGDTVNLASRIEALNKPFGTDILVSQETYELVKGVFRFEPMKAITVKGKLEPQQIYAVLGRLDDPYCPASLAELQANLGIQPRDLSAVNVDEEEVKYKIIDDSQGAVGRGGRGA